MNGIFVVGFFTFFFGVKPWIEYLRTFYSRCDISFFFALRLKCRKIMNCIDDVTIEILLLNRYYSECGTTEKSSYVL